MHSESTAFQVCNGPHRFGVKGASIDKSHFRSVLTDFEAVMFMLAQRTSNKPKRN